MSDLLRPQPLGGNEMPRFAGPATMMRLPAVFDISNSAKARRDLERLLRASVSWDGPGRP